MDESEWLAQQSFTSWQSATESHDQEQIWQAKRSAKDILAGDQPKVLNSSVESKDIHLKAELGDSELHQNDSSQNATCVLCYDTLRTLICIHPLSFPKK